MKKQFAVFSLQFSVLTIALLIGASFPLQVGSAQFIDRIIRPCSSGIVPRAQVIANPNNTGNVQITTCTGGSVTINGTAIVPGSGTINATNTFIPYRLNATTFADSPLARTSATVITSTAAFNGPAGGVNTATYSFAAEPTLGWIRGAAGQLTATSGGTIGWFDVNGWHGFGTKVEVFNDTAMSTDGFIATTNGNATVGVQKLSPRIRLSGSGWKTDAVAGAQMTDWIIENTPVQGTANPSTNLVFSSQVNAGGYTPNVTFTSAGNVGIGTVSPKGIFAAEMTASYLIDTYFTDVPNPTSGAIGWHINKPSATGLPIGISFDVDGVSKWEIDLDYQNSDLVLAYSKQDPTAIGDKIRMSPDGRTCISPSCSSPSTLTAFLSVLPDSQANKSGSYTRALDVRGAMRIYPYPASAEIAGITLDPVSPGINTPFSYLTAFSASTSWPLSMGAAYDSNRVDQYVVLNGYLDGGSKAFPTFFGSPDGGSFIKDARGNLAADGLALGYFAAGAGQTPIEVVRIAQNSNVGIGTMAPLSKLSINGGLHVGGDSDAGDNNLLIDGNTQAATYSTVTNCADSAGAAACGVAAAGAVVIDAGSTSVIVSTTAVTATSRVMVVFDSSLGTELGITCNTTAALPFVTARTAATSFTITVGVAPAVNPGCFTYWIVN